MKILGIETTSKGAGVAVVERGRLIAEYYLETGKYTHLEKLIPMVDKVLKDLGVNLEDINGIAVSVGPGSFTGIRIGIACAQGISQALKIPIIPVNTLDSLAYNIRSESLICPVIDAQRKDVYAALFRWEGEELIKVWDYVILNSKLLLKNLIDLEKEVILVGDGANKVFAVENNDNNVNLLLIKQELLYTMPRASSVAMIGFNKFLRGEKCNGFSVKPFYMRKSHAEEKWEERHGKEILTRDSNRFDD